MLETIATTLEALARIDSGSVRLRLDETLYTETAVRNVLEQCRSHVRGTVERLDGALWLSVEALDAKVARLQIGNVLTDLLRISIQERP